MAAAASAELHVHWPNGGAFEYPPPMGLAMNGGATFTGRRALVPLGIATYFGPSFGLGPDVPSFRPPGISSAVGRFGPNAYKTNSIVSPMLFGRGELRSAGFEFVNPNFRSTSFGAGAARLLAQQQFSFVGNRPKMPISTR
uniref:Uncharacterized protein n=1 Tax=Globodera rostochiensis TaxID=31243 RepID=A0A914H291_GLORO